MINLTFLFADIRGDKRRDYFPNGDSAQGDTRKTQQT